MTEFLLKWLIGWAKLIEGILLIVSLTKINLSLSLSIAKVLSRYRWRERESRRLKIKDICENWGNEIFKERR